MEAVLVAPDAALADEVAGQAGSGSWVLVVSKKSRRQAARDAALRKALLAAPSADPENSESEAESVEADVHSVSPSVISTVLSADNDVWLKEIPYVPKTSSRRATQMWAQARKGSLITVKGEEGYFVYGSYGEYGLEY